MTDPTTRGPLISGNELDRWAARQHKPVGNQWLALAWPDALRLIAAAEHAQRLDEMLRKCEWGIDGQQCPYCGELHVEGHIPDCRLAQLIPTPNPLHPPTQPVTSRQP